VWLLALYKCLASRDLFYISLIYFVMCVFFEVCNPACIHSLCCVWSNGWSRQSCMNEWLHVVKEWCSADIYGTFWAAQDKKVWPAVARAAVDTSGLQPTDWQNQNFDNTYNLFAEATRKRAFNLVARAYSCISIEDLCSFVGMSASDVIDGMCVCFSVAVCFCNSFWINALIVISLCVLLLEWVSPLRVCALSPLLRVRSWLHPFLEPLWTKSNARRGGYLCRQSSTTE